MVATQSQRAAKQYARVRVETAPVRMGIYLLHEKCVHLIGQARIYTEKRRELAAKAQNILAQLQASLVMDDSVAESLYYLYDYCWILLEKGEDSDLMNAHAVLLPLRNTFYVLLKKP
jgi:flagellin-specific chaperone FliS